MTDKELLELAAKAAGMPVGSAPGAYQYRDDGIWVSGMYGTDNGYPLFWNPLIDDRDALRLAVSAPTIIDLQWIIAEAWQAHDEFDARMAYVRRAIVEKIALPFARTTDTGGEA
ncbi:hypothetical protein B7759_01352 [Burkholderia glumae]|uniref:hypothetical protein n=1 Tax=Burkholderia glumae TaxID=337 RepID=UPI001AE47F0B|nr:hypothetical protein [Burkholderia glumae]QTP32774.1 hypothetical protein B7759_01352 [Burkholderia glumae]